jgi:hypothetical protein
MTAELALGTGTGAQHYILFDKEYEELHLRHKDVALS